MFSENNKLSVKGISKLVLTQTLGMTTLFAMYISGQFSLAAGLGLLSAIYLFSCLFLTLVCRILQNRVDESGHLNIRFPKAILVNIHVKSFLCVIFAVLILIKYVHEQLLPGTNTIFLAFVIFLFALPTARKPVEIRGRFCELMFFFVAVPILATLIYQICTIDYRNVSSLFAKAIQPSFAWSGRNLLRFFLIAFFSFLFLCPWDYLLKEEPAFHEISETKKALQKVSLMIFLLAVIQFTVCSLTYPVQPVLSVIISVMVYISTALHYGIPNFSYAYTTYAYTAVSFCAAAALMFFCSGGLSAFDSLAPFENLYTSGTHLIDAREPESRSFVLSMIIRADEEDTLYICELADYSSGEEITSSYVTLKNLESYAAAGGKPLDFSHIEAVVLDDGDYDISPLLEKYRIPSDTLLFQKDDFPKTYEYLTANLDTISLGEVLKTLAKNQNISKEYTIRNRVG
jgi:hypothetical protein